MHNAPLPLCTAACAAAAVNMRAHKNHVHPLTPFTSIFRPGRSVAVLIPRSILLHLMRHATARCASCSGGSESIACTAHVHRSMHSAQERYSSAVPIPCACIATRGHMHLDSSMRTCMLQLQNPSTNNASAAPPPQVRTQACTCATFHLHRYWRIKRHDAWLLSSMNE